MKQWGWLIGWVLCAGSAVAATGQIPTDFRAGYLPLTELEQKLTGAGLTVLGKHAVAGNSSYTSVVYTSDALKKLGQKDGRGFISVLRILHNAEKEELLASNPEYFIRAFYQKEYREDMAVPIVTALKEALGELEPTDDSLKPKKLEKYKFMVGMPKYDDFVRVAKGETADLLSKLEGNAAERVLFKLDIKGDGSSMLCGVALPDGIEKFNEKLGTMGQGHLLPYTVLIENGEANILHAKFYLALSFPRLTMTEFMRIMSVPGDIADAFKADFK